ncbi:MAG TPA: hypothetical protein VK753_08070, partial [Xanthomonadaceae bacterium]|nr:hypothetical protein [Xanthomonadaceae bacterium]
MRASSEAGQAAVRERQKRAYSVEKLGVRAMSALPISRSSFDPQEKFRAWGSIPAMRVGLSSRFALL